MKSRQQSNGDVPFGCPAMNELLRRTEEYNILVVAGIRLSESDDQLANDVSFVST